MRILDETFLTNLFASGGDVADNTVADRLCAHMVEKINPSIEADETNAFMDLDDFSQRLAPAARVTIFRAVCQYGIEIE